MGASLGDRKPGRIRVLAVLESFRQGGAEQSLLAVQPRLIDLGVETTFVVGGVGDGAASEALSSLGLEVLETGESSIRSMAREIRLLVRRGDFDVVHPTLFGPVIAAGLATLATPVPVLASLVNTAAIRAEPDPAVTRWKLWAAHVIEALSLHLGADHVHAVTPGTAASAQSDHHLRASKVTVVERGRDPAIFQPDPARRAEVRASMGLDEADRVVLAVGRHEHQKGYEVLLTAFRHLQDGGSDARLLIAGRDGNATSSLRSSIAELPRPDRVEIMGVRDDMADLYRAADVFVSTSWREGAAGAVVEAWASGCPVVTTAVEGLAGIAMDGINASVVPVGDARAVAGAVDAAFGNLDLTDEMAANGRQLFFDRFTVGRSAEELAKLYRFVRTRRGRLRSLGHRVLVR